MLYFHIIYCSFLVSPFQWSLCLMAGSSPISFYFNFKKILVCALAWCAVKFSPCPWKYTCFFAYHTRLYLCFSFYPCCITMVHSQLFFIVVLIFILWSCTLPGTTGINCSRNYFLIMNTPLYPWIFRWKWILLKPVSFLRLLESGFEKMWFHN